MSPSASRTPESGAGAGIERARLQQWLCFIGTELHKGLFMPLLEDGAGRGENLCAGERPVAARIISTSYLEGREFLLDHFSVADAYLVTVMNWTMATPPIDLAKWPNVKAYYERMRKRPSIARAWARKSRCTRRSRSGTRRRREPRQSSSERRALSATEDGRSSLACMGRRWVPASPG